MFVPLVLQFLIHIFKSLKNTFLCLKIDSQLKTGWRKWGSVESSSPVSVLPGDFGWIAAIFKQWQQWTMVILRSPTFYTKDFVVRSSSQTISLVNNIPNLFIRTAEKTLFDGKSVPKTIQILVFHTLLHTPTTLSCFSKITQLYPILLTLCSWVLALKFCINTNN